MFGCNLDFFCLFFRQLDYSRKFDILKSDRLLVSLDLVPAPPLVQTYKEELSPRKVKLNGSGWPGTSSAGVSLTPIVGGEVEVFSTVVGTPAICAWPGKASINVMHNISSVMQDCSREWFTEDFILISFADFIGLPRQSNHDADRCSLWCWQAEDLPYWPRWWLRWWH